MKTVRLTARQSELALEALNRTPVGDPTKETPAGSAASCLRFYGYGPAQLPAEYAAVTAAALRAAADRHERVAARDDLGLKAENRRVYRAAARDARKLADKLESA